MPGHTLNPLHHIKKSVLLALLALPVGAAVVTEGLAPAGYAAEGGRLSAEEQRRINAAIVQAQKYEQAGEPVQALLEFREAVRLEQLWTSNTAGDDSVAMLALGQFQTALLRRDDGSLLKILHSPRPTLADKLGLLRMLEEDVILHYRGRQADQLLQGFHE